MCIKKQKIQARIEKAQAKWVDLLNQELITQYKIRLLKHKLLTVKDRPDISFVTEMVPYKGKGKPKELLKIKYRCWVQSFQDESTGEPIKVQRKKAIYVNGLPVDDDGVVISKPELLM